MSAAPIAAPIAAPATPDPATPDSAAGAAVLSSAVDVEWRDAERRAPATSDAAPVLVIDGFEGPLDWLVDMARAGKVDLARLSIVALVDAVAAALRASFVSPPRPPDDGRQPLPAGGPGSELVRAGRWLVLAAQLVELRSRLLLPRDAPEAVRAQAEAEALRRAAVERVAVAALADWLERQPQLGRDVFARGRCASGADVRGSGFNADLDDAGQGYAGNDWLDGPPDAPSNHSSDRASGARVDPVADITELLRGCLAALRLPAAVEAAMAEAAWRAPSPPLWRVPDAMARIVALLGERPGGGTLGAFLPPVAAAAPRRDLLCRAAVASTLLGGLELARDGTVTLEQDQPWQPIHVRLAGAAEPVPLA